MAKFPKSGIPALEEAGEKPRDYISPEAKYNLTVKKLPGIP
jgi:hypothetical protein